MFLLIDNYDSFTYNLVQAFMQLGRTPHVVKNDDPGLPGMATRDDLAMVCLSPGPSNPVNAGLCLEFLAKLPSHVPVLGVCLGHQILGHFAGAPVVIGKEIMHGKQSDIVHNGNGLFTGIASPMTVGRYHSLTVLADEVPERLIVTARTTDESVMALRYTDRPWAGVQFHPESVLTPEGIRLLANFPSALLARPHDAEPAVSLDAGVASAVEQTARAPLQMSAILERLAQGKDLTPEEAHEAFSRLMEGDLSLSQSGALLMGLRAKGETPEEVGAAVSAVLAKAVPVPVVHGASIDVVGTGGDSKGSFNCSTATSLVLAGMGYKALKHGNRSVSSRCGSADVLEKLGVPLDTAPEAVPAILERDGFAFLFAPQYHPAFRHVMPVRRELGIRTLFNILGPLVNPAAPTHHLLGVADPEQLELVAKTLAHCEPNCTGAVVHGAGGYDELTTMGPASVIFVRQGSITRGTINPSEYGFPACAEEDLTVEGPDDAVAVLREILKGKGPKTMQDMLAMNVGLALYLLRLPDAEEAVDPLLGYDALRMRECMETAAKAVADGAGARFGTAYNER